MPDRGPSLHGPITNKPTATKLIYQQHHTTAFSPIPIFPPKIHHFLIFLNPLSTTHTHTPQYHTHSLTLSTFISPPLTYKTHTFREVILHLSLNYLEILASILFSRIQEFYMHSSLRFKFPCSTSKIILDFLTSFTSSIYALEYTCLT